MNTTPDDTTLALWLDDELDGADHAAVEAWAATQPDRLHARDEHRRYKAILSTALPASEEPPYPEFFNARIVGTIRRAGTPPAKAAAAPAIGRSPLAWFMPVAAAAGMVAAFWLGNATGGASLPDAPVVYVTESGIDAEWIVSSAGKPGVIVLSGLEAIPDATDFAQTAYMPLPREADRTAGQSLRDGLVR